MTTDEMIRAEIRTALDRRLSGVTERPDSQQRMLRLIRGEEKIVKKKLSFGMALVLALMLLTMAAALATGGFGLLDFKREQADNSAFIEHILPVGQAFENDDLTMTVNEAVFNGATLSFTMDMIPKRADAPVYILPAITAEAEGEALTTTFENCTGGFSGLYGFWLPQMDPRMESTGRFGVEVLLCDASGQPYHGDAAEVTWHLSFQILRPDWPVSYAAVSLPADDSDETVTEAMAEAYDRQFAEAYADKRILLSSTGSLLDYMEQQMTLDGSVDFEVALTDKLTHCEAFTVTDCPVITFTTAGVTTADAALGQVFDFADGWHAELTQLDATFDRVECGLRVTRDASSGATAAEGLSNGDYWTFAILADDGLTQPYAAGEGVQEDGSYTWHMTVTLSAPIHRLTLVPCRTIEDQGMVFQSQQPCTEEQAAMAFSVEVP